MEVGDYDNKNKASMQALSDAIGRLLGGDGA